MSRPSRFQAKSKAIQFLYDRYIGDDPDRVASFEQAGANAQVAQAIYDLRTASGLSQAQLAERVGTARSVISRLEDADYDGHSLAMLRRIALALGQRVEIRFTPIETEPAQSSGLGDEDSQFGHEEVLENQRAPQRKPSSAASKRSKKPARTKPA